MTWEGILVDQKKFECKQTADGLYLFQDLDQTKHQSIVDLPLVSVKLN